MVRDILTGVVASIAIILLIVVISNWEKIFGASNVPAEVNSDGTTTPQDTNETKCELKDAYGRSIIITGKSDDPQFQLLCQQKQNQQMYVYGYPYYFVGFHRGHRGGHGGHGGDGGHH